MASASQTASLRSRCIFIYCIVFFGSIQHVVCYTPALIKVKCRDTVDLRGMNLDSGLIVSELPERIPIYPHEDQRCDIFLSFAEGNEMMFYFDDLDLYSSDRSKCDSTNIQFFDGSGSVPVKGLEGNTCGRRDDSQMPTGVYYVLQHLLIIRANSNGVVQGSGFKIHFTIYRRGFPCAREEFSCESYDEHSGSQGFRRCVDQQLVCDEWNDCGDWADEKQNCNDLTAGAVAAIVLVSVGLLALIVGLIVFCKIRRQREIKLIGEKEASAVMRDTSFTSSRGGAMLSPFSISNETLEKDRYIPRYSTGRNSARRGAPGPGPQRAPHYVEDPPPYSEKPSHDDSPGFEDYEGRPRSRQKRRGEPEPDEVFEGGEEEEEEPPRMRRGRSRSQEGRAPPPPREDRYPPRDDRPPSRRDDRDSPRSDRYSRDDRRPPRDDRYPSRRDDSPPGRYDDRDRDRDRPGRYDDRDRDRPGRYDDRDRDRPGRYDDRDRDRPPSRYDVRDRERPPSRHDQRDRDRERDRERSPHEERDRERDAPRRERPPSRRSGAPEDRPSSGPEDDMLDQLHPLREHKRRSMHSDSDPDASREDRRTPRDRSPYDDRHQPGSRDDREPRARDSGHRPPPRDDRRDDLHPPRGREDRSSPRGSDREDRPPRDRDDRPRDRNGRGPRDSDRPGNDRARDEPRPQHHRLQSITPDDSYEDVEFRHRPPRGEDPADDSPPRNRRQRSRSRDGQDGPRSSRPADDSRRQNASYGGYKEESV